LLLGVSYDGGTYTKTLKVKLNSPPNASGCITALPLAAGTPLAAPINLTIPR
jgi:hypothetical protein